MNTELFTGKAESYAKARPGYPQEAMDYISTLISTDAVIADIGAGTGKFTEELAKLYGQAVPPFGSAKEAKDRPVRGYKIFAVEPNFDMRKQLSVTLAAYSNISIIARPAETTTLPNQSIDVITCAQALHWFEPDAFRAECRRIGKPGALVIAIYNNTPGGSSMTHSKLSTDVFFNKPTIREFPNPIFYTRENWISYMTSHSHDPLPTDSNYAKHIEEVNAIFDHENVNGLLKRDVITKVFSEKVEAHQTSL